MSTDNVDALLQERGSRYGLFSNNAMISQRLVTVIRHYESETGNRLSYVQREAIEMIFHKIARIVCGDPDYADNWDDIAGYAMLGKGKEI